MNFARQEEALSNAYSGLQQQASNKLTSANDALTQAVKLTQLNFDEASNSAKTLIEGGMEGIGGLEGAHQLWRAGKKIYSKLKAKADEFNKNELDKLDQEAADRTEDSFKVKVEGEDDEGLDNINDDENFDEEADTGMNNATDNVEDFAPYRDAPTGELDAGEDIGENLGDFGENLGTDVFDNLSSNIGEMGGEAFTNAFNALKSGAKSGIDSMKDLFNGIKEGGTDTPEIEMTDLTADSRMPVQDFERPYEYSRGNFGEKVDPVNDDDGIELTDFQKNTGSLQEESQNLEQNEDEAEDTVDNAENDALNDGDVDAVENTAEDVGETVGEDVGEDLAETGTEVAIEEGVGAALDATPLAPLGWILGAIGGLTAVGTTVGGIVKEVQAGHQEENALAKANQAYQLAKAKVANFNPAGNYAIPSMNSLATIGQ